MAEANGLDFPIDKEGKRSTSAINQAAFVAAVASDASAKQAAESEKKWRFGYAKHVVRQTQLAASDEKTALTIAADGLAYLHNTMEFIRDGESLPLAKGMQKHSAATKFKSHTVQGSAKASGGGLEVPYHGKVLKGEEVKAQVETWVRRGVIELDTGAALCKVVDTNDWLDLSKHTFVLFGAGSAMGPFPILMALGAHVVAVDLPIPKVWTRLLKICRESPGKLTVPVREAVPAGATDEQVASLAGCDLLKETPEVLSWLVGKSPSGVLWENGLANHVALEPKIVLGAYCYLDGPLFVKVSMAMDAIIAGILDPLPASQRPALAYLCTPTDAHVCTASARDNAMDNLRKSAWWQPLVGKMLGIFAPKMAIKPNKVMGGIAKSGSAPLPVVDALVVEQGPNYCLAKRLQHWRAIVARQGGSVVASNIAPATATVSVVSNKAFALAYKGMHHFKPMEVFQPETSNHVMTALLVNDLRNPLSAARPTTHLENPMQLFAATAFHGGAWRTGYKFGTIGPAAAIAYIVVAFVVKAYLTAYNFAQFAGWAWALRLFLAGGVPSAGHAWAGSMALITTLTYGQLLEVFHAASGMVRSNPVLTFMQIGSRVMMVQVINCHGAANLVDGTAWISMLILAWSVTEVVRYLYYGLNILGLDIAPLTWLRYSTFLLLYPIGVSGELGCFYLSKDDLAPAAASTDVALACPCGVFAQNAGLVGFAGLIVVYIACFPMLFGSMLGQRKKVLGGKGGAKKDKKA